MDHVHVVKRSKPFSANDVHSSNTAEYATVISGELEKELDDCSGDVFELFQNWIKRAVDSKQYEDPHAMQIATANRQGRPSNRTVLLRFADENGFRFCTDSRSPKATEIEENPQVALVFYWGHHERQVRVTGTARRDDSFADEHFKDRPFECKVVAKVCQQSKPIESRAALVQLFEEGKKKFADNIVERPEHWVGYCVVPETMEFRLGHKSRLNERLEFTRLPADSKQWVKTILQPY